MSFSGRTPTSMRFTTMNSRAAARAHVVCWTVALLGLPSVLARPAKAQQLEEPRARQGYWVALGLAGGGAELVEKGKHLGMYPAFGLSLRVGQMLTRGVGVGLTLDYAAIRKNHDSGALGDLAMEVSLSPWRDFALHAGAGFGVVMVTDDASEDKRLRGGVGASLLAGASYDFFPGRSRLTGGWAITPTLDLRAKPDGGVHAFALIAGVQVIRWSGLPSNMLFPSDE
jgi:hypothetical protein